MGQLLPKAHDHSKNRALKRFRTTVIQFKWDSGIYQAIFLKIA